MSQDIRIDRLSLRVPGLDEDAARDLARLIAQGLAAGLPTSDNPISDYPRSGNRASDSRKSEAGAGSLSVSVAADGSGPEELAWRIAGEIWRAMEREVNS